MRAELTGARLVWGQTLFDQLRNADLRRHLLPFLLATIALAGFIHARRGIEARLPRRELFLRRADLAARLVLTAILLEVALRERLRPDGIWAGRLFWCTVALLLVRCVLARRVDIAGVLVVFTAWMATLSWGAPTPILATGACAVYLADAIWRVDRPLINSAQSKVLGAGAVLATLVVVIVFVDVRTNADYGTPRSTETVLLGALSDKLSGVYTDQNTASYLRDVARCTKRYEAKWVAVVPEGALAYPIFDLRNPFPIDWFWADDYRGDGGRRRLLAAASRTDARGDYLVLFQTRAFGLPESGFAPRKIAPFVSDPPLADELASRLRHATSVVCGEFVAYYNAGRGRNR